MSRPDLDYFATWLDTTLDNKGWSNRELARKVGVHDSVVGRWVAGKVQPSFESALRLGVALGEEPMRMAATAGYSIPGFEPLPLPPPTAQRARIRRELEKIRGLGDGPIEAALQSWDARHSPEQ